MSMVRTLLALGTCSLLACGGSTAVFPDDPGADTGTPDTSADDTAGAETTTGDDSGSDSTTPSDSGSATDSASGVDTNIDTGPPKPCTASGTECGSTEYCEAPTCDKGVCRPRPTVIAPFEPACGCDGVTYFSAAYAGSLGRSSRPKSGECSFLGRKTCGPVIGCPHPDDLCVHQVGSSFECGVPTASGVCWGMPKSVTSCPGGKGAFTVCGSTGCYDQCVAIMSGKSFYAACK